jgi:hypothetical protein
MDCACLSCCVLCAVCCVTLQVHKVIDGFKSRGEKPDVGNNVSAVAN